MFDLTREHTRRISQSTSLPSGYTPLLADLKARVRAAQVRAVLSVDRGNEVVKGDANLFLCPPNDLM